jgi:hypothetical protein
MIGNNAFPPILPGTSFKGGKDWDLEGIKAPIEQKLRLWLWNRKRAWLPGNSPSYSWRIWPAGKHCREEPYYEGTSGRVSLGNEDWDLEGIKAPIEQKLRLWLWNRKRAWLPGRIGGKYYWESQRTASPQATEQCYPTQDKGLRGRLTC